MLESPDIILESFEVRRVVDARVCDTATAYAATNRIDGRSAIPEDVQVIVEAVDATGQPVALALNPSTAAALRWALDGATHDAALLMEQYT